MVKTRDLQSLEQDIELDLEFWLDRLVDKAGLSEKERSLLRQACELSLSAERNAPDETNHWLGSSSFRTGLEMADILADLHIDLDGLLAAILYRAVRERKLDLAVVRKQFSPALEQLISGVLRMAVISTMRNDSEHSVFGHPGSQQANKIREMLVSIIDDVRVALIKIAERTCAIRAAKNTDEEKKLRVAREVFDVYAPLAHRLGIGHLKWELEDLAFRYLEPEGYKQIARLLDEKRLDRQQYIQAVVMDLRANLDAENINGEVTGRPKHIYSIWRKMQKKDIGFSQVYDIRAVRILVPNLTDCYAVLGIVHNKWRNIPREFDDYIASPKENGYRSLHTAVIGPEGKVLEVQIRTFAMHEEAELGVCSHWRYKDLDAADAARGYEEKIAWLRQVLEWHDQLDGEPTLSYINREHSSDRIYAFTPDGHVVDLPRGSTPLDFAYRIHTTIGHRCRGAKVNDRIVPLSSQLATADQVEILTGKHENPSRDWMSPSHGYLHTNRARSKVQQWFRKQDYEKNLVAGRSMLEREMKLLGLRDINLDELAVRFNKKGRDGLYAALGAGDINLDQVLRAAQGALFGTPKMPLKSPRPASAVVDNAGSDLYIYGVGNLMTSIARCCQPLPGEPILGYITTGRGVTIHREDCSKLLRLRARESQRILQVSWGGEPKGVYPVSVVVEAYDRGGLLRDISTAIDRESINIVAINSRFRDYNGEKIFVMDIDLEVTGLDPLSRLLARLQQIPNIIDVHRVER